jgi:hypothetical protein
MRKKEKKKDSELISHRKALKKSAASRLGISPDLLHWINGRLCFLSDNSPVEGVPKVSKPEKPQPVKPAHSEEPKRSWWRPDTDPYNHRFSSI